MELKDLIVRTKIGTKGHEVNDLVYLPTYDELVNKYRFEREDFIVHDNSAESGKYWLRNECFTPLERNVPTAVIDGCIDNRTGLQNAIIYEDNMIDYEEHKPYQLNGDKVKLPDELFVGKKMGIRPCVRLDVNAYMKLLQVLEKNKNYSHTPYQATNGKKEYMCLNFGEYPDFNLSSIYSPAKHKQVPTGKEYLSPRLFAKGDYEVYRGYEYSMKGKKFVNKNNVLELLAPVVPLQWRILNWQELPTTINPKGTGTATTIDLMSHKVLNEMPYQYDEYDFTLENRWKSSLVRNYLNGYEKQYTFECNFDFLDETFNNQVEFLKRIDKRNFNFINEAFDNEVELLKRIDWQKNKVKKHAIKKSKLAIQPRPNVLKQLFAKAKNLIHTDDTTRTM